MKSKTIIYRPNNKKKVFWAISKTDDQGEYQGIVFPDGHVEIGIDCWRQLDRNDCPSYEIYQYRTMTSFLCNWVLVPIRKSYYMNKKEDNYGYLSSAVS